MGEKEAWDEQYRRKGALWRGSTSLHFQVSRGEKVLELGCGNGKTTAEMLAQGAEVVGLDFSAMALQQCVVGPDVRSQLVQGDVLHLPFAPGSFELVNCSHVLEHLLCEERGKAAEEAASMLRPGGRLAFQAFSVTDMRCGVGEPVEAGSFRRGDGILYHYFTDEEVRGLFSMLDPIRICHKTLKKRYHGQDLVRDMVQAEFTKR